VCVKNETCFLPVPVEMGGHIKDLVIRSLGKTQADKDAYQTSVSALKEDIAVNFSAASDPMPGNPQTITLYHSPYLKALGGRRGRGMVRD